MATGEFLYIYPCQGSLKDVNLMYELPIENMKVLEKMMEEMANMPDTGPPERLPGERCMYEIQRREHERMEGMEGR